METIACTHQAIQADVPLQLWEAITTDGTTPTPLFLTRFFHNKPVFYFLNYARCYFYQLSPLIVSRTLGNLAFIGLLILLFLLFKKGGRYWKITKLAMIVYPLFKLFLGHE